ncbi:hypothetical protein FW774_00440 (plasmid) [Pedobacter sp. BS3]|uniref:hypothetical protein n=1 Tax=Pedobacter sp. BS3 TaxID=2567937 RepID=UPI0011EE9EFF|nr:hypothetical protein [Pedobacter sp. BS3]TZF85583.1 hypothetical protein FW774_00440 [Pedobacter sp. BS3]
MVTVTINEKGKGAKALIELLSTFSYVKIHKKNRYNAETEKAIEEARAGIGIIKTKSHADLMKKLRS